MSRGLIARLARRDVVVTAPGDHHDFVSRYFWPANGGDEAPVTGSIHAVLAPRWAVRLGKTKLLALQASRRSGVLHCEVESERVRISDHAQLELDCMVGHLSRSVDLDLRLAFDRHIQRQHHADC
ncbi:PhzF family phenazine biosynthesis protein [Burkholderia sp. MR1-5-21]